jgi:hypothetical protein
MLPTTAALVALHCCGVAGIKIYISMTPIFTNTFFIAVE